MKKITKIYLFIALSIAIHYFAAEANYQQDNENLYQREHSLVKPYQGSGMVSNVDSIINFISYYFEKKILYH